MNPQTENPAFAGFSVPFGLPLQTSVCCGNLLLARVSGGILPLFLSRPLPDRKAHDTGTGGHYSAPYNWQKRPATTKTRSLDMHRRVRITGDCGSPTGSRSAFNTRPFSLLLGHRELGALRPNCGADKPETLLGLHGGAIAELNDKPITDTEESIR